MKLLFITKEDCLYCVEKREMVYHQLPEIFDGLVIKEYDILQDAELIKPYYKEKYAPAFVFLTDQDKPMFNVYGVPPTLEYIKKMLDAYQANPDGFLNDDELDMVVGGLPPHAWSSSIPCDSSNQTCIQK